MGIVTYDMRREKVKIQDMTINADLYTVFHCYKFLKMFYWCNKKLTAKIADVLSLDDFEIDVDKEQIFRSDENALYKRSKFEQKNNKLLITKSGEMDRNDEKQFSS